MTTFRSSKHNRLILYRWPRKSPDVAASDRQLFEAIDVAMQGLPAQYGSILRPLG